MARIHDKYYAIHNWASIDGVSHKCYNAVISSELNTFFAGKDLAKLNATQAQAFVTHIQQSSDCVIKTFLAGVQNEADEAARVGAKWYQHYLNQGLTDFQATKLAKEKAEAAAYAVRRQLNAAAKAAGRKVIASGGRWRLPGGRYVPGVAGGLLTFALTGDANAAALDATLPPVALAVEGGKMAACVAEGVRDRSHAVTLPSVRTQYGTATFHSARNQGEPEQSTFGSIVSGLNAIMPHNWLK